MNRDSPKPIENIAEEEDEEDNEVMPLNLMRNRLKHLSDSKGSNVSSEVGAVPVRIGRSIRAGSVFNASKRKNSLMFYKRKPDEEIEGRLLLRARAKSIAPMLGKKNQEVVMVPVLLNDTTEGNLSRRVFHSRARQDLEKFQLNYVDLMAMQLYGTPPTDGVISVLGRREDEDQYHNIFCELLQLDDSGDERVWKERARWVKYEECIEESGDRWSKPHVSMLNLHSVFELRKGFLTGALVLDLEADSYEEIVDGMLHQLLESGKLKPGDKEETRQLLMINHQHGIQREDCCLVKTLKRKCCRRRKKGRDPESGGCDNESSGTKHKFNKDFLRKIPPDCDALNIMVGETDFLKETLTVFVRLEKAVLLDSMPEVKLPTKYMFVMLGPIDEDDMYADVGRAMATIMSDEIFREIAYFANTRNELISGVDEFMSQLVVLPPGKIDPEERVEPPYTAPCQKHRLEKKKKDAVVEEEEEDLTLKRTGRLFGGLMADVKRKAPFFVSDLKDGLHIQCLASFFFMYIACLTPVVTFGGLLSQATDNYMGAMESLVSAAICGTTWHLFSGQPLTILGATGPVLVFESLLYNFAVSYSLDFLSLRLWVGIWVAILLLIMVSFDLSFLVRYITRFTEEGFAMLIALIFMVEAFKKLYHIMDHYPVDWYPDDLEHHDYQCFCRLDTNGTASNMNHTVDNPWLAHHTSEIPVLRTAHSSSDKGNVNHSSTTDHATITPEMCKSMAGILTGSGCSTPLYVPDVFLFSCLLFIGTFAVAVALKGMRNSSFFPSKVRSLVSDFAVPIAILSFCFLDFLVGIHTPKLLVPEKPRPTRLDRGWIVNPLKNPVWCIPAAIVPALLATVLVFMDQQITAVIVNRKEHKLQKGSGYHLDLLLIAIQIAVCSLIGTPWFVAATVLSINHVRSLSRESETSAPGERPKFLGVREQRVTGFLAFIFVGSSAFLSMVLKFVPMPVLYGVFLYMGVSAMNDIQLVQRVLILFMPTKYQPDYTFLRHVKLLRVHLFTAIQVVCLTGLWVIKTTKMVSILFPVMVLALCFIRKAMDCIFTKFELSYLDDILPESDKQEAEDEGDLVEEEPEDLGMSTELISAITVAKVTELQGLDTKSDSTNSVNMDIPT